MRYEVQYVAEQILLNNGEIANPLSEAAKSMKAITAKTSKNKSEDDHLKIAKAQLKNALYHEKGLIGFPAENMEAALLAAAKKSREGQIAKVGIFVDGFCPFESYQTNNEGDIGLKTFEEVCEDSFFSFTKLVKVSTSKVPRTRPIFQNVKGKIIIEIDETVVNPEVVNRWAHVMMGTIGLGDWRPRFGRGQILSFELFEEEKVSKSKKK